MEVFVLLGCTRHEGSELLGVYASVAEAESARDVIDNRIKWDDYEIERRIVGAEARADWERTNV